MRMKWEQILRNNFCAIKGRCCWLDEFIAEWNSSAESHHRVHGWRKGLLLWNSKWRKSVYKAIGEGSPSWLRNYLVLSKMGKITFAADIDVVNALRNCSTNRMLLCCWGVLGLSKQGLGSFCFEILIKCSISYRKTYS